MGEPGVVAGVEAQEVRWAFSSAVPARAPIDAHRVLAAIVAAAILLMAVVAGIGLEVSRRLAESEAVRDAAATTDLMGEDVVEPVLRDGLRTGDERAIALVDAAVRSRVLDSATVRVKIWAADGTILYSDEPRLIGRRFAIGDEELAVLRAPATEAEVSDAAAPENVYERGQGRMLEVYRPVRTPGGTPLLFETYSRYDRVEAETARIWQGFAALTLGSIVLVLVILVLLLRRLLGLLERSHEHREALLTRAVDASAAERRRIAASLHDGVVQDLVATSFLLSAGSDRLPGSAVAAKGELTSAARTVRESIGGLRSLLVDIYPPSLKDAGLEAALQDLGLGLTARGIDCGVRIDLGAGPPLPEAVELLVFRIAHEALVNVVQHAHARSAAVTLRRDADIVELVVEDDGDGFDPASAKHGEEDHFGLRLLADAVRDSGLDAELRVRSAPGRGTRWTLAVRP